MLAFIKSQQPHQTAPSVQTSREPYSQPRRRALCSLQDSAQSCLLNQQQQLQLQPHLQVPSVALKPCIIDYHRTKILVLKLREKRLVISCVASWSRLMFPHFSIWIHYKTNLPCLREKQVEFWEERFLDCSSGNVQHNDEWVGGWIKLRLLDRSFYIISSLAPVWDYIGHDLAMVGIEDFNIANVWIWYPRSDPSDCSQLVTGLEWMHLGLEERSGSCIVQNGWIDFVNYSLKL